LLMHMASAGWLRGVAGMPWAAGQHLVVGRQVTESVLLVLHQTGATVVEMGTACLTMNLTLCQDH